jgi:hypothetical protein
LGQLITVDFGRTSPITLTKLQFARHPQVRRSGRWVEQRMAEGMPATFDGNRRMFDLEECLAWLENRRSGGEPRSNEAPPVDPPDPADPDEAEQDQPPDAVA